ncbi:hypothetical protein SLW73_08145 [Glutamicibacter protophormiae]|uniref:P-loop ATPase, Sll1717 family n=1 Tax=Glutamicibacter protophormiae TaxID=37930 RepID=UPI002A834287|nr:hypothetical protein [Glutamicibacter protophormiae]WPR66267.1 hypothetical protein SLW72_08150 [Glutamicibacter protophormiae]WPR69764.1 hypothetical protein SLW73_08145 [Glutamicibacter protophormiae]
MKRSGFEKIQFGYASAEAERANAPELLLQGYYDNHGVVQEARNGNRFVFLGYKGSGKSAIGQKLVVDSETDPELFVTPLQLKDFPFNAFGRVGVSTDEPETRYPTSWAWLIHLRLLSSFKQDQGAICDLNFRKAVDSLIKNGILPDEELRTLVTKSSKNSFKAQIPKILEATRETSTNESGLGFLQLVNHLREICRNFRSQSRHILVIDGLDDVLTQREIQYKSLAALLQEAVRINEDLVTCDVPAKVIVLCRTDIFELFPDGNKNKIRQDSALSLDWYHDTRNPEDSALVHLADLRIQVATGDPKARLVDYLPKSIDGEGIIHLLLSLTRHTPRDFLQLLESIRAFAIPGNTLSVNQILSGMRRYSIEYFLPEIKDELVGVLTPAEIEASFSLFSAMRSRDFKYSKLREFANESGHEILTTLPIDKVLQVLYDRSAIGTVHGNRGYDAYTFKFRNRNSTLGFPDRLMMHKGIWKAMNFE